MQFSLLYCYSCLLCKKLLFLKLPETGSHKNTNILAKCERQESDLNPFSPLTNRLRVTFPKMHFRLSCTLFDLRQDPLPPFKINSGLETSSPLLLLWLSGLGLPHLMLAKRARAVFCFVCGELSCDIYSGGLVNSTVVKHVDWPWSLARLYRVSTCSNNEERETDLHWME